MDLIDRQAAIDAIMSTEPVVFDAQTLEPHQRTKDVIAAINELPSAQPGRKKGKWIDGVLPNDTGGLPVIVCDQCNTFYPLQFGASHNFCPNCGADMRGGAE